MFRIPDKKPIVLAGSVVLFATSLMHTDVISVILGKVEFIRKFWFHTIFCSAPYSPNRGGDPQKGGRPPMLKRWRPSPYTDCLTPHILLGCIRPR